MSGNSQDAKLPWCLLSRACCKAPWIHHLTISRLSTSPGVPYKFDQKFSLPQRWQTRNPVPRVVCGVVFHRKVQTGHIIQ